MKNAMVIAACLFTVSTPSLVSAQTPKTAEQLKKDVEQTQAIKVKVEEAQRNPRFVQTLTNVQLELTLSDQVGAAAAEKKTVSMIASSGSWGKIRSAATIRDGDAPYAVLLNVDARPLVTIDGAVQLELTFEYAPLKSAGEQKEGARQRPSGINQSQTVILQSGKPLIVSQAADPVNDRKVVVEVKATVLK
ncbi:MAG TPA: hypothetical protein VM096_03385 [Vicinamibacterales bacterium]|nr:hypothetical protein [Vicinamibacterales bacterium]